MITSVPNVSYTRTACLEKQPERSSHEGGLSLQQALSTQVANHHLAGVCDACWFCGERLLGLWVGPQKLGKDRGIKV